MKKNLIATTLIIVSLWATAQPMMPYPFNNVYANFIGSQSAFFPTCNIESNVHKRIACLGYGLRPSGNNGHFAVVSKIDVYNRTVVYNKILVSAGGLLTQMRDLYENESAELFVAGFNTDNSLNFTVNYPCLMKFDSQGNLIWSKKYPVNCCSNNITDSKISIVRLENEPEESYFLVVNSTSDVQPGNEVINVMKIRIDGSMQWSKKYNNPNSLPAPYVTREIPGDIAFSPGGDFYMITGRQEISDAFSRVDRMFFFGINKDGKPVTKFKLLKSGRLESPGDMMYDPDKKQFAAVYTNASSERVRSEKARINMVCVDNFMNTTVNMVYIDPTAILNYGISVSPSFVGKANYVIGNKIYSDDVINGSWSPSLLKVDGAGFPSMFTRYNTRENNVFGHHCLIRGDSLQVPVVYTDRYAMIDNYKENLRVIFTDVVGSTCKEDRREVEYQERRYSEEFLEYDYRENFIETLDMGLRIFDIDPEITECVQGAAAKVTGINNLSFGEHSVGIYPNPISVLNQELILTNTNTEAVSLEVFSISGQSVYFRNEIQAGNTPIQLGSQSTLPDGIYISTIKNNKGEIIQTQKLVIAKN
jgi:hypothetical protein